MMLAKNELPLFERPAAATGYNVTQYSMSHISASCNAACPIRGPEVYQIQTSNWI